MSAPTPRTAAAVASAASPDVPPGTPAAVLPGQVHRLPAPDARVRAAAAVLAGESVSAVAARHGVDVAQLLRWADGLSAGGAAGVAGVGVERPASGGRASLVPVDDWLAVVAHELRTPLTAARAGLRVLARDGLDPDVRAQVSAAVRDRLDGLEQLAADVADAVGLATGRTAVEPAPLDLVELLAEACAAAGLTAPAGPPVVVTADARRTRAALVALLRHASRYRPGPGGLEVRLQQLADAALVTVRAEGVVLSPAEAAGSLEPFGDDRAAATAAEGRSVFAHAARGDGNGLALYVVRAAVVAQGGAVGVAGDDDSTVFWVRLPLGRPVLPPDPAPPTWRTP